LEDKNEKNNTQITKILIIVAIISFATIKLFSLTTQAEGAEENASFVKNTYQKLPSVNCQIKTHHLRTIPRQHGAQTNRKQLRLLQKPRRRIGLRN
jgi:hypothetical protein